MFLVFTHLAHYLYDATFLFLTVSGPLTIPLSLMGHSLLAVLTNGFISALNEIRECAPLKITAKAAASTTECLQSVAVALGDHHQRFSLSFDQVSVCGCGKTSFLGHARAHIVAACCCCCGCFVCFGSWTSAIYLDDNSCSICVGHLFSPYCCPLPQRESAAFRRLCVLFAGTLVPCVAAAFAAVFKPPREGMAVGWDEASDTSRRVSIASVLVAMKNLCEC